MPIFPPRQEPIKKQEELTKREIRLVLAVRRNADNDELIKLANKYKQAQLSLVKAKIHQFKENEYQKKPNKITFEQLEESKIEWTNKTDDEIIKNVKASNKL